MSRTLWFVAGAGAGVYVMIKARRAAEALTPDGLRDRLSGLGAGAHVFAEEVRTGMGERESELRQRLGLALEGPPQLEVAPPEEVARLEAGRRETVEEEERTGADGHR